MTNYSRYAATAVRARQERRRSKENRTVTHRVYPIHRPAGRRPDGAYFELTSCTIKPDGGVKGELKSNGQTITIPARNVAYIIQSAGDAPVVGAFDPDDAERDIVTAV